MVLLSVRSNALITSQRMADYYFIGLSNKDKFVVFFFMIHVLVGNLHNPAADF